jgi:hypothetical protein
MNENELSVKHSIYLIEGMINMTRNHFCEKGHMFLVWGWVILICSTASFISLHYFQDYQLFPVWLLACITIVYHFIYIHKQRKKNVVITYADEINRSIRVAFIIIGGILEIILTKMGNQYLINTVLLVVYAIPTFLSGVVLRFIPLKLGAIACCLLAYISTSLPYKFSFLLLSAAIIAACLIPGYLLATRFKE